MFSRFREMYNNVPKPINVEPMIHFKYMDEDGNTIDFNTDNKDRSGESEVSEDTRVSQRKVFRKNFLHPSETSEDKSQGK